MTSNLDRSDEEILAELRQIREKTAAYITFSQVQELVARLPIEKLPTAYHLLADLSVREPGSPSLQEEFMLLPLAERRRFMAEQAGRMAAYYEERALERDAWQAGDFVGD